MTLACTCGTQMMVGPDQLGKLVQCSRCCSLVAVPRTEEEGFRQSVQRPSAPPATSRRPRFEPPPVPVAARRSEGQPWEIWGILAIGAFFILTNVLATVEGSFFNVGPVVFGIILLRGIWQRAGWAWGWELFANIVGLIGHLVIWAHPSILPAEEQIAGEFLVLCAVANLAALGMLISVRARGAFAPAA